MNAILRKALLAGSLAGLLLGGAVPAAADTHPEAQPASFPTVGTIQRPGDEEWYSLPGDEFVHSALVINQVRPPASCTVPAPLRVGLYNPEGSWIRSCGARVPATYSVLSPSLPGRYLVKLSIESPACSGLQYTIQQIGLLTATPVNNHDAALLCKLARKDLVKKQSAQHVAAKSRRNLAAANRAVTGATQAVNHYCA